MADTTSSTVSPFNFGTHAVRVVMQGAEPLFVAADVCDALDLETHVALRRLDDDEKGRCSIPTPGGIQELTTVNESGMYSLVLGSRKPEAKRFKKWVTSEVLPAIRKTGTYTVPTATISEAQCQHLQELVQLVVQSGKQTHGETWKRFHNKMKVASYRNLPAERFNDAVTYLKGKLDDETMLDLVAKHLAERMPAALEMAMVAASGVFTETVRQVLTAQDSPSMIRLMVGAQHVPGKGLQPMAHTVRHDQCLMSFNEMTKAVNEPGGLRLSNADLFGMLGAVTTKLSDRNADQQARLAA